MTPTPEQSLAYLESVVMTPARSLDELSAMSSGANLLELFAQFFPKEFRPFKRSIATKAMGATQKFLQLVGTRLFPIMDYLWGDAEEIEYAYGQIPIAPVNDDWWERDPHDLHILDRAILLGAGAIEADSYEYEDLGRTIDFRKLQISCKGPLKNLPDLVRVVFHDTGNGWLDLTQEEASNTYEPWDREVIDELARVWKAAKPILKRTHAVYAWVGEDETRAAQVRELVASCTKVPIPVRVRS